ncbi:murein L,D-transpeptidase catalytic domain-containing protein [Chryseobacterium aquaeductus]|nr:murein L,D-transpeptidase catalytic domain family protein [Chryseobacterium aquaeductus]
MKQFIFLFLFIFSCSKTQSQQNQLSAARVLEIKNFVSDKNYNKEIAIFINFKTHSGKYRYFVYDLKNDKILQRAMVSHGSGSVISQSDQLKFSNVEGSYQSSLGKYEIRESYTDKFGKSYRLQGLDSTNNNAMQRAIVLHSYDCIPNQESDQKACLSLGCPMLSKIAFDQTAKYIDQSKKQIILYAFY